VYGNMANLRLWSIGSSYDMRKALIRAETKRQENKTGAFTYYNNLLQQGGRPIKMHARFVSKKTRLRE